MNNKGISTIIAIILMLVIAMALAGSAWLFVSGVLSSRTATAFSILDAYGDTVTIMNDGTEPITSFTSVTVNRNPANYLVFPEDSSLVGYWKLDSSGSTITDSSRYGNTGTFHGANDGTVTGATWVDGVFGKALSFDGTTSDYASIPVSNSLELYDNYTVEMWINHRNSNNEWPFHITSSAGGNELSIHTPGSLYITHNDVDVISGKGTIPVDTWVHIAATYGAGTVRGYINGVEVGSSTGQIDLTDLSGCLALGQEQDAICGGFAADQAFDGTIDEVRIYSRVLTDAEITNSWARNASVDSTNLVGYWKLDEGSGSIMTEDSSMWKTGKYGGGLEFDGVNDYVEMPSIQPESLTVEVWLKLYDWVDQVDAGASHHVYPSADGFGITTTGTYWRTWIKTGGTRRNLESSFNHTLNEWHHIVLTYDKATGYHRMYVDRVEVDSQNLGAGTSIDWGGGNLRLSQMNWETYGVMDEVRIYNRSLTEEEVKAIYDIGTQINPGIPVVVKIYDPLPKGTHTVRICTPSMCQGGFLTIV